MFRTAWSWCAVVGARGSMPSAIELTLAPVWSMLGMSRSTVRQARLVEGEVGYRRPPVGWERVIAKMAAQGRRAAEARREAGG